MSNFITQQDYQDKITDHRLQQLIDNDPSILDGVEDTAISIVRDALFQWYDVEHEFSKTGTDRDATLVRFCINLCVYFLYERVPDKFMPQHVQDNYNHTLDQLDKIEQGKKAINIKPAEYTNDEGEQQAKTKFRWGSLPARQNDPYTRTGRFRDDPHGRCH